MLASPEEDASDDEPDEEPEEKPWEPEDDDEHDEPIWLGVLPENHIVVEAFHRCRLDVSIGMGAYWQTISATEVRSACALSRVPPREWPRVTDGVQLMGRVTANARNEAQKKAQSKDA